MTGKAIKVIRLYFDHHSYHECYRTSGNPPSNDMLIFKYGVESLVGSASGG
jgi:hypothetical protein